MSGAKSCLVALSLVWWFGGVAVAQTVDNPAYQGWSNWREGASVTTKTESAKNGKVESSFKQTQTLKSLSAEKAVVNASMELEVSGKPFTTDPTPTEIVAKFKAVPQTKNAPNAAEPKTTKGQEKLTVNGKTLSCEWQEYEIAKGQTVRTWTSDDVPGRTVKMVSTNDTTKTTIVVVVVDWKGTKK